jgi:hypothetical protein
MDNGVKVSIPLDSKFDINSNNMLVPVTQPLFAVNRQKLQGLSMPNSVRYEADGTFAGWYNYQFDYPEMSLPTTPAEHKAEVREFKTNDGHLIYRGVIDGSPVKFNTLQTYADWIDGTGSVNYNGQSGSSINMTDASSSAFTIQFGLDTTDVSVDVDRKTGTAYSRNADFIAEGSKSDSTYTVQIYPKTSTNWIKVCKNRELKINNVEVPYAVTKQSNKRVHAWGDLFQWTEGDTEIKLIEDEDGDVAQTNTFTISSQSYKTDADYPCNNRYEITLLDSSKYRYNFTVTLEKGDLGDSFVSYDHIAASNVIGTIDLANIVGYDVDKLNEMLEIPVQYANSDMLFIRPENYGVIKIDQLPQFVDAFLVRAYLPTWFQYRLNYHIGYESTSVTLPGSIMLELDTVQNHNERHKIALRNSAASSGLPVAEKTTDSLVHRNSSANNPGSQYETMFTHAELFTTSIDPTTDELAEYDEGEWYFVTALDSFSRTAIYNVATTEEETIRPDPSGQIAVLNQRLDTPMVKYETDKEELFCDTPSEGYSVIKLMQYNGATNPPTPVSGNFGMCGYGVVAVNSIIGSQYTSSRCVLMHLFDYSSGDYSLDNVKLADIGTKSLREMYVPNTTRPGYGGMMSDIIHNNISSMMGILYNLHKGATDKLTFYSHCRLQPTMYGVKSANDFPVPMFNTLSSFVTGLPFLSRSHLQYNGDTSITYDETSYSTLNQLAGDDTLFVSRSKTNMYIGAISAIEPDYDINTKLPALNEAFNSAMLPSDDLHGFKNSKWGDPAYSEQFINTYEPINSVYKIGDDDYTIDKDMVFKQSRTGDINSRKRFDITMPVCMLGLTSFIITKPSSYEDIAEQLTHFWAERHDNTANDITLIELSNKNLISITGSLTDKFTNDEQLRIDYNGRRAATGGYDGGLAFDQFSVRDMVLSVDDWQDKVTQATDPNKRVIRFSLPGYNTYSLSSTVNGNPALWYNPYYYSGTATFSNIVYPLWMLPGAESTNAKEYEQTVGNNVLMEIVRGYVYTSTLKDVTVDNGLLENKTPYNTVLFNTINTPTITLSDVTGNTQQKRINISGDGFTSSMIFTGKQIDQSDVKIWGSISASTDTFTSGEYNPVHSGPLFPAINNINNNGIFSMQYGSTKTVKYNLYPTEVTFSAAPSGRDWDSQTGNVITMANKYGTINMDARKLNNVSGIDMSHCVYNDLLSYVTGKPVTPSAYHYYTYYLYSYATANTAKVRVVPLGPIDYGKFSAMVIHGGSGVSENRTFTVTDDEGTILVGEGA